MQWRVRTNGYRTANTSKFTRSHGARAMMRKCLLSVPWLRKPQLAGRMQIANAPQILQSVMTHIQPHMAYLSGNQQGHQLTGAGAQPSEAQASPSMALGHARPPRQPSSAAPAGAPARGQTMQAETPDAGPAQPAADAAAPRVKVRDPTYPARYPMAGGSALARGQLPRTGHHLRHRVGHHARHAVHPPGAAACRHRPRDGVPAAGRNRAGITVG
jgi:hypothetical protein